MSRLRKKLLAISLTFVAGLAFVAPRPLAYGSIIEINHASENLDATGIGEIKETIISYLMSLNAERDVQTKMKPEYTVTSVDDSYLSSMIFYVDRKIYEETDKYEVLVSSDGQILDVLLVDVQTENGIQPDLSE